MHQIKINRAAKICAAGRYPLTYAAIIAAIPPGVVSALPARQLAALADAMRKQHEAGHSAGYADAQALT